jgi:hypothetical protein
MFLLLVLGGLIFRVFLLLAPLQLIVFIRQSRSIRRFISLRLFGQSCTN